MFNYSTNNSFNRFGSDLIGDDKFFKKNENFHEFCALENCLFFYDFCLEDIILSALIHGISVEGEA